MDGSGRNSLVPYYRVTELGDNERITEDGGRRLIEQELGFPQFLTGKRFVDPDTFYTSRVGAFGRLVGVRYVDPDLFYTATTHTRYSLRSTHFVDPDSFYQAVLVRGTYTLTGTHYRDPDTFYSSSLAYVLASTRFVDPDIFYQAGLITGPVTLQGQLFVDPDQFYPSLIEFVHRTYTARLFVDPDIFYPGHIVGGTYPRTIIVEDSTRTVSSPETSRVLAAAEILDTRIIGVDSQGRVVVSTTEVLEEPTRIVASGSPGRAITTSGVTPEPTRVVASENKGRTVATTQPDDNRVVIADSKEGRKIAATGKTRKVAA